MRKTWDTQVLFQETVFSFLFFLQRRKPGQGAAFLSLTIINGVFGKVIQPAIMEFNKAHPNCTAKLEKF